jgi:hypothetical protein
MLFDTPYEVKGKHATYIRFINAKKQNKDDQVAPVFEAAIDVYIIAPLIGVAYGLRAEVDTESKDTFNIFLEVILKRQKELEMVYRLVLLCDKSVQMTNDALVERAFKSDEDPQKTDANLNLFHQYFRGGLEWLYEFITRGALNEDDYINKIDELVHSYADDFGIPYSEDD